MADGTAGIGAARNLLTFAAALAINSIATVAWYWWHLPAGLATYLPHLTTIIGGFLVGFFAGHDIVKKLALLAVLIAVNDGLIHWFAAHAGMTGDMTTFAAIAFMSSFQTIYNLALVFLGGALGWATRQQMRRRVK